MLALMVLFLVAVLTGSRSKKTGFWFLTVLQALIFFAFCAMWHDVNRYPGLLSSAFANQIGQWIIAMVVGLMIGGVVFGGALKKKQL